MLWCVRHIVVSDVIRKIYCCKCCATICHTFHITNNSMSYASQRYQQHVLCITTLTTIYFSYHNSDNNMSYVSQDWKHYFLYDTTLTTLCLACHNANNNMSYVSQHWWYIFDIVVIRKKYCCRCWDTQDILLSVLWYVRHIVVRVVIRKNMSLTTICLTYHNTDNNMSDVSQRWQQYVIRFTAGVIIEFQVEITVYCDTCTRETIH
jgi:hypothetical protein